MRVVCQYLLVQKANDSHSIGRNYRYWNDRSPVCPIRIKKPPSCTLQSMNLSCAGPWPVNFTAVVCVQEPQAAGTSPLVTTEDQLALPVVRRAASCCQATRAINLYGEQVCLARSSLANC
jgi:hypothetical protein